MTSDEIKLPDFAPFFSRDTVLPTTPETWKGYRCRLDEQVYRKFTGVNASLLKNPTCCEMLHDMTKPRIKDFATEPAAKKWTSGLVLHDAVLEPWKFQTENFDKHFVKFTKTKGIATAAAQECRAENPGKLLINGEYMEMAMRCMDAIHAHDRARDMLALKNHREASGFVWDGKNLVWRKHRLDFLPTESDFLLDIKTTAKPLYQFKKEGWSFDYWLQAAWYLENHFLLTGERRSVFWWIVVTKEEPFMCDTFFMRNLTPDHPAYNEPDCTYRQARERLGLDASERLGRLPMFLTAARETEQLRARGVAFNKTLVRRTWPGYEQTDAKEIF